MKTSWARLMVVLAIAASLIAESTPVTAGSTSLIDPDGVDYDAACLVNTDVGPPSANSVPSPGTPGAAGYCDDGSGISAYDGSTEGTDLGAVVLESDGTGWFFATVTPDGPLPDPGNTNFGDFDMPGPQFNGVSYWVLYQNKSVQTNVPTNASGGGCNRVGTGTPIYDMHGSWKDGYHFGVGYDVSWDGLSWVHAASIGIYDPSPNGGFRKRELARARTKKPNDEPQWEPAEPELEEESFSFFIEVKFTWWPPFIEKFKIGFKTKRKYRSTLCNEGVFTEVHARPGDLIANVKAISTANQMMTLPVDVPVSALCGTSGELLCAADVTTLGGFLHFSDVTVGNSTAGLSNTNISGIAHTFGALGFVSDTLGDGPTCPTPTFGGLLPQNPLFTPDTACMIDDDAVARGSFLPEFWETTHGFTA